MHFTIVAIRKSLKGDFSDINSSSSSQHLNKAREMYVENDPEEQKHSISMSRIFLQSWWFIIVAQQGSKQVKDQVKTTQPKKKKIYRDVVKKKKKKTTQLEGKPQVRKSSIIIKCLFKKH